ncbi:hypothetical protein evm_004268 [Chilo suppressalis]|nr:hypothetical protein evm_004268 [Chilo suppressalis]
MTRAVSNALIMPLLPVAFHRLFCNYFLTFLHRRINNKTVAVLRSNRVQEENLRGSGTDSHGQSTFDALCRN